MFSIDHLHNEIIEPLSLKLTEGECLVITGPSGSGKTRFLRAIADLDEANGDVRLGDDLRSGMEAYEWRQQVRFVASEAAWWFDTVAEHFQDISSLKEQIKTLELDEALVDANVHDLSTGERQRFAFLRAIADRPPVLLLDEPTSALDERSKKLVEALIFGELQRGVIVLMVTHDKEQASKFATHSLTFEDGRAELKGRE